MQLVSLAPLSGQVPVQVAIAPLRLATFTVPTTKLEHIANALTISSAILLGLESLSAVSVSQLIATSRIAMSSEDRNASVTMALWVALFGHVAIQVGNVCQHLAMSMARMVSLAWIVDVEMALVASLSGLDRSLQVSADPHRATLQTATDIWA